MADKKKPVKKEKVSKKTQTVRERSEASKPSKKRVRATVKKVASPVKAVKKLNAKEYHVIPLPDNKAGRVLRKRVRFFPKFVSEAFTEVKQVSWPSRKETVGLTLAVFVFAIVFASIVGLLDFGLSKAFEKFIVN